MLGRAWKKVLEVLAGEPAPADPVDRAWEDFQQSWDWAMEPPTREVFNAGYAAGRKALKRGDE